MNSISSLIDLAAQGTIGVKSGLSETLDAQLAKSMYNLRAFLFLCGVICKFLHMPFFRINCSDMTSDSGVLAYLRTRVQSLVK